MSRIIRRTGSRDRFTIMDNAAVRDPNLTLKARGLLLLLLSHRDGWELSEERLAGELQEGRHAIRSAIAELETHGYLTRTQDRGDGGRMGAAVWVVTDQPSAGEPSSDNPTAGDPTALEDHSTEDQPLEDQTPSPVPADADPADEYEPEVRQLCREFAQRLVANRKGVPKRGTGAHRRWLEDMRKLLEYGQSSTMEGGHVPTVEDVALVIAYVTTDDFERDNVLSPGKLRKRWDQLYGKATRASTNGNGRASPGTAMDVVQRALATGRYQ